MTLRAGLVHMCPFHAVSPGYVVGQRGKDGLDIPLIEPFVQAANELFVTGHGSIPGWCERRDSNPHGFTRQNLNLVRLPIPPLSLAAPF